MSCKFFSKFKSKQTKEKTSKGNFREFLAKLSRALMLPVAMLPIAGLFLGIGSSISSSFDQGSVCNIIGTVIAAPGNAVFAILPLLFAVAIAITFTGDAGTAGLSAVLGWFIFVAFQAALLSSGKTTDGQFYADFLWIHYDNEAMYQASFQSNAGFLSLATGVFGGIVIGLVVQALYNRFKNIVLPSYIAFFQGVRFIPIVTFVSAIALSMLFSMVWPYVSLGLYWMGVGLQGIYGFNSFIFGTVNRMLEPFGLHHVLGTTMWFTPVGGTFNYNWSAIVDYQGQAYWINSVNANWNSALDLKTQLGQINGDIYIFTSLTNIAGSKVTLYNIDGTVSQFQDIPLTMSMIANGTKYLDSNGIYNNGAIGLLKCNPGQYTSGNYLMTMFGLPACALAMIMAAPKGDNRKMSMSILISAMIASFLTGITEPIEFTFLFLAPWLFYGFHCIMNGIAMMICYFCHVHLAYSFSASFLDYCIWGIPNEIVGAQLNAWVIPCFGVIFAALYYVVFYFVIKKFDIATPGRGNNTKLISKADYLAAKAKNQSTSASSELRDKAIEIIKAYGGLENIKNVDACITKLRIQVANQSKVDLELLKQLGALGVTKPSSQSVYAVFGQLADRYKNEIKAIMLEVGSDKKLAEQLKSDSKLIEKPETLKVIPKLKKSDHFKVMAPVSGKLVSASQIKDETFSKELMGKTCGIIPNNNSFLAPISGELTLIADTGHAYAIKNSSGLEVLVHIGIDTVTINQNKTKSQKLKVFEIHKKVNQKVKAGDLVITADLNAIKNDYHLDPTTAIVLVNNEHKDYANITFIKSQVVTTNDDIIKQK